MNEYVNMALVGFDGQLFNEARYHGTSFLAVLHEHEITLFSNEAISKYSAKYRDGYKTSLAFSEVEELKQCKMFALYKGNEYKVQMVSPRLREIELLIRDGFEKEDYELGFEDNFHERIADKFVTLDEIEGIRVEKQSVYRNDV